MRKTSRSLMLVVLMIVLVVSFGAVSAQDKTVIHWWHIDTAENQKAMDQGFADAFMAAHPDVSIEITVLENEAFKAKLATVMQSGTPPDLFQSWGGGVLWNFAEAGLLRDITPELTADNNAWKDSFSSQGALNLYSYDGKYYGIPYSFGAVGFWYNTELFKKAGIEATPTTWDELLSAVQKLKDAGITPISIGEKDKWPGHFWWASLATRIGGEAGFTAAFNRTGSFADAPFVKAGELFKQLVDLNAFQDGFLGEGYTDEAAHMGNGEAAMELMGQWAPAVMKDSSKDKKGLPEGVLAWFPFPSVADQAGDPSDVFGGGDGFAFGKNAPDATIEFAKFIFERENLAKAVETKGILPVVKGMDDLVTDPQLKAVLAARDGAKYYQSYYDQFLPPAVAQAVLDAVQGLSAGTMTPEEAAQMVEDAAAIELAP